MMKKSLCVVFVLALIAQICARPADEKADPETKVKDAVVTEAEDAKDKVADVVGKATEAGKELDHKKRATSDAIKHGKETSDSLKTHGEDCHKPDANTGHHSRPISDSFKKEVKIGKKLFKRGEDIVESLLEKLGL